MSVYLNSRKQTLFTATGSKFTIITPAMYQPKLGKVVAANCLLRALCSNKTIDVKGMVRTTITTKNGAPRRIWI